MQTREGDPPGLPLATLGSILAERVPEIDGARLQASLISGGRSNLTYLLTDGTRRWVLRRPPLGAILETAHDMGREYRMIEALHHSRVPVPRPVYLSRAQDESVFGSAFFIMGCAEGEVLREEPQLAALTDPEGLSRRLMRCLADLHAIDPHDVGLGGLGRPDGYLERQIERWLRQVATIDSALHLRFEDVAASLRHRVPTTQRASLVHGDYRLDNVVVDTAHEVVAVLDWEMATRGDPLADVASALIWWDGMRGLDSPVAAHPGDIPGYPSREVLAAAYARESDLDLTDLDWYLGFAFYKIAAIFEGIRHRHDEGMTLGAGFERIGPLVPHLLESAASTLSGSHSC
ncbi:phosphotransferase family protein [Janibacter cremeus]|uniref:Aminoglycoside phosphotransferase (APT) family kinase protein n=1 Tax=Janibacter cremeus TaxID=1285192 RepID=A0A852VQW5_9MICO|nr:phosphotransferase family protein [Janibacter cremeus]NYF96734.1 aminoglycoside phosphotransferase (APT) family kinase protein [Janibacter cremeus]